MKTAAAASSPAPLATKPRGATTNFTLLGAAFGSAPFCNGHTTERVEEAQGRLGGNSFGGQLLKEEVTEEDIARVVASWTGIPVNRLQEGERCKLVTMEERLGDRVIGQRSAIGAISNAVRRARAGGLASGGRGGRRTGSCAARRRR